MTRGVIIWAALGAAMLAAGWPRAATLANAGEPASLQQRGERAEWRGRGLGAYASARVSGTLIYGPHPRQQIDIYAPDHVMADAPLIFYIHGGGWSMGSHKRVDAKPAFFMEQDAVFASAGYRVLPDAPVEDQAADLGAALRAVRASAADYGFDPDKIILMGHSAGAHLAALLGTDPQYAGTAFDAIRGAVLVDGGGYDIALALTMPEMIAPLIYRDVFGPDPARHTALSPITHAGGRDAADWLIVHVADRAATARQAQLFSAALRSAGRNAGVVPVEATNHMRINREIGTEEGAAQNAAIAAFIERLAGG